MNINKTFWGSIPLAGMLAFAHIPVSGAVIKIENHTAQTIYVQPEDSLGFRELPGHIAFVSTSSVAPVYYRLVDGQSNYHSIYVEGSDTLTVSYDGKRIDYQGRLNRENEFLNAHIFNARTPENIALYSAEWVEYNKKTLSALYAALDNAGLDATFVKVQKLYYRNIWLQQLMSVNTMNLFGHGNTQIGGDYFDFLKGLTYGMDEYAFVPNWFSVMTSTFEEMERRKFISTTPEDYMIRYAECITSPSLRSHYLLKLLQFTLKKGYTDDFLAYLSSAKPYISEAGDKAELPLLEKQFAKMRQENSKVLRGEKLSPFVANDMQGKAYRSTDFLGKILVVDFWFTGCVPCRAEMPYFDQLSLRYKGKPVQFLSVSLDTGTQLLGKWREMMINHKGDTQVLFLNLPDGFKNSFTKEMNIRSVPRIMLIDQEGKIIDAYAKRPSDPKLQMQLDALLR